MRRTADYLRLLTTTTVLTFLVFPATAQRPEGLHSGGHVPPEPGPAGGVDDLGAPELTRTRRVSSLGNGLFYDSGLERSANHFAFGVQNAAFNQDAQHAIYLNAYQGADSDAAVDYAGAWIQDDDSAFLHKLSVDISENTLWSQLTSNYQAGFRPVSISGIRTAAESRFTVAWIRDNYEFDYDVIVNENANDYQLAVDEKVDDGFRIISASGYSLNGGAPRFTALLVRDGLEGWVARHNLPIADYQAFSNEWWGKGYRPISLSGYVVGGETFMTVVMVKDTSGAKWVSRHGISAATLAAENNIWTDATHAQNNKGKELRPSVVAAYEHQGRKEYFAVWQSAGERRFRKTGLILDGLTKFDNKMRNHMQDWDVTAASLCVMKDGEIKAYRGYTWAPEAFETTMPWNRFRIGSISKPLTTVALMQMIEEGTMYLKKSGGIELLSLDTEVFDVVGMPDVPAELGTFAQFITVRQLLNHSAGWDYNVYFSMAHDHAQGAALGVPIPLTREDKLDYMFDPTLWPIPHNEASVGYVSPGTFSYANIHFSILATLMETLSPLNYDDMIQDRILDPLSLNETEIGRTARLAGHPAEVTYSCEASYSDDTIVSASNPAVHSVVGEFAEPGPEYSTKAYGVTNVDTIDATGGFVATTKDMVNFLDSFSNYVNGDPTTDTELLSHDSVYQMWDNHSNNQVGLDYRYYLGWQVQAGVKDGNGNPMRVVYHRGAIEGGYSIFCRRPDGVTFAAFFNRKKAAEGDWDAGIRGKLNKAASNVVWPAGAVAN